MLLISLLPSLAYGITDGELHDAAHFGGTYVITHGTEVVCNRMMGGNHRLACTLGGVFLANVLNVSRKVQQKLPGDSKQAIASGLAGSVAAALIIGIDF